MKGHILRLFGIMFIIFLIEGNLTAPSELTSGDSQVDGVMGAFYHIGKFIVVPFENLKYRLSERKNSEVSVSDEVPFTPQVPPGYVEDYFEFQGEKYKYYKPVNPPKSPVKENFTLIKINERELLWKFSTQDLFKDMNSDIVNSLFKTALDGVYGKYDKKDKEFVIYTFKTAGGCGKGWCEKANLVGVGWWIEPVQELGLPLTPEVIRGYFIRNAMKLSGTIAHDEVNPSLPSEVILGKAKIDCDAVIPLKYTLLYKLNKAMGIKAEYYKVSIYPPGGSFGHAELFVHYPDTGKWEVYSFGWISATHYYKYSGKGVNFTAWEKYTYLRTLPDGHVFESIDDFKKYMHTTPEWVIFVVLPEKFRNEGAIYVKAGKIQFNSFEEALYWYLYWSAVSPWGLLRSCADGYCFSEERAMNVPISVVLYKLPTPEDPYVYRVKEWSGRKVTVNSLREELVKKGQYREIDLFIEMGEAPPKLKNPEPMPPEWLPPRLQEWYYKEKARMEAKDSNNGGESGFREVLDLLVKGFRDLFRGTRLG